MKNRVSRDLRDPPGPKKQPGSIEIGPGGWGACFEAVFQGLKGRRQGPKNRVFQKSPRTSSPCSPWPGEPPGGLPVPSWGPIGPMGGAPPHGALGSPIGPMYMALRECRRHVTLVHRRYVAPESRAQECRRLRVSPKADAGAFDIVESWVLAAD